MDHRPQLRWVGRRKEERGKRKAEIMALNDLEGTLQICKCGEGISDRWMDHQDNEGICEGRDGLKW